MRKVGCKRSGPLTILPDASNFLRGWLAVAGTDITGGGQVPQRMIPVPRTRYRVMNDDEEEEEKKRRRFYLFSDSRVILRYRELPWPACSGGASCSTPSIVPTNPTRAPHNRILESALWDLTFALL